MRSIVKAYLIRRPIEDGFFIDPKETKMTIWKMVDGYKTYLLVALFVVMVAVEKGLGWDVPGFEVGDDWLAMVMGALGLGTLRAGIAKV